MAHIGHLFDHWSSVKGRVKAARHVALFLDFDGTLVRIRRSAAQVRLDPTFRHVIRRLSHRSGVTVWVISGRRYAFIRERINVPGAHYLGVHGWEIGKGVFREHSSNGLMGYARRMLAEPLRDLAHIRVEDKQLSLAVHYRGADAGTVRRARHVVDETLRLLEPQMHVLRGKKIWELLPREVEGKGAAVRALLTPLGASTLPIYIGDDVSDEPAFAALPKGITARVGASRHTAARFYLRHPGEVREFLERLEKEIT